MADYDALDPDDDAFRPPAISIEVCCLHCQQEFDSYLIQWVVEERDGKQHGFWCCPTPGCDGKGFGFDIFPTDPEWKDPEGRLEMSWSDDEDEYDGEDEEDWQEDFLTDMPDADDNGEDSALDEFNPDTNAPGDLDQTDRPITEDDLPW